MGKLVVLLEKTEEERLAAVADLESMTVPDLVSRLISECTAKVEGQNGREFYDTLAYLKGKRRQ